MQQPTVNSGTSHSMRPLRALYAGIFIAQLVGAIAGLSIALYPSWFENLWKGAALLTLPGYAVGWGAQKKTGPVALQVHGNTVRRIGVAAAMLSIAVFSMPFGR
ncbi:MAG: hypothetical protein ACM3SS_06965 [Rhodospirillaceae bacterium]